MNVNRVAGQSHPNHERANADTDVLCGNPSPEHNLVALTRCVLNRFDSIAQIEHIGIGAGPAHERVGSRSTDKDILAVTTLELVVPGTTHQLIIAGITR